MGLPTTTATVPLYPLLTGPLTVERVTVPIVDLPAHLSGTRVVQLSDFHFDGLRLPPPLLQAAIAQCNALDPDLVVLTGDFVTKDPRPIYPLAEALSQLRSRQGVYAVLGNHDDVTPEGRRMIMDGLQRAGATVLWNAIAYPLGPHFPMVGLADLWSGPLQAAVLFDQIPPATPRLLLAHNPDTAALLGDSPSGFATVGPHPRGANRAAPLGAFTAGDSTVAPLLSRLGTATCALSERSLRSGHPPLAMGLGLARDRWGTGTAQSTQPRSLPLRQSRPWHLSTRSLALPARGHASDPGGEW
jgi:hypothetical protein